MDAAMSPGFSAPSAPAAQDGPNPFVVLPPLLSPDVSLIYGNLSRNFYTPNPISQDISVSGGTILNTALGTHIFYPGTVMTTVTPSPAGAIIQTVGKGSGSLSMLNNVLGHLFFGLRNFAFMMGCAGAGNPNNG
jgi:hypothetical protein